MKKRLISLLLFTVAIFFTATAQPINPVSWKYSSEKISDTEYSLIFKAELDAHWHLYSTDLPEGGPVATTITLETPVGYELVGKVEQLSKIHKMYDETFKMDITYFEVEAIFSQKIRLTTTDKVSVKAILEYQVCDDSQCLFLDNENIFTFNSDSKAAIVEETVAEVPVESEKAAGESLWWMFALAFVAGMFALLTPCVFPMIPMTVSFFMNNGDNRRKSIRQALFFGFSIIAIYTIVGTVVAVTLGANFANWLSTHWIPNVFFFVVFVIFAASFFGMFEITLPSGLVNKSDKQADKGGLFGPFFMAFTLVVVSFSCTGPIVGAILVKSAGGQILEPVIGMFGFSLAFALPFTLFAVFPSMLNKLPKSGGWLNSVKVVLGFIELALGLKFLSIADQTYHWGILDREIYLAFWIVIFFLMGVYLLGKIKFSHDSDVKHVGVPRLFLAIGTFTFVMYLIPGMFGAPLKALSGYLPPQSTHDFDISEIIRNNSIVMEEGNGNELCEKPKYADVFHLPHGLRGYFDYEQGLKCAQQQNKPVFIDFTGHGCVNCREMEARVWSDPRVLKKLKEEFVIIALYVDDKTKLPESEWITSKYDGNVKKTIGKKYSDLQISRFNVNAQPYYCLLDNKGELLIDPMAYNLNVDEYLEFLDKAIDEFKNR